MLASQVTEILLHCNCQKPGSCGTRRCRCFKLGEKCTNYCHRSNEVTDSCINLASIEERNIRKLVPRVPTNITPSVPVPAASTTAESQVHTRCHYTRSRKSLSVPEDIHHGCLEDTLDNIIVRKP